jgi:predicted DNA-binding transcriptional regulator AlpA
MTATTIPGIDAITQAIRDAAAPTDPPLTMPADDAARLIGISRASLYRGVSSGAIPGPVQTAGGPRWRRADLVRYVERLRPAR